MVEYDAWMASHDRAKAKAAKCAAALAELVLVEEGRCHKLMERAATLAVLV
jgi:hypothetical protein